MMIMMKKTKRMNINMIIGGRCLEGTLRSNCWEYIYIYIYICTTHIYIYIYIVDLCTYIKLTTSAQNILPSRSKVEATFLWTSLWPSSWRCCCGIWCQKNPRTKRLQDGVLGDITNYITINYKGWYKSRLTLMVRNYLYKGVFVQVGIFTVCML